MINPRRAALIGVLFVGIAIFYVAFQASVDPSRIDLAGTTMLVALGAAMSLMAYVLLSGARRG